MDFNFDLKDSLRRKIFEQSKRPASKKKNKRKDDKILVSKEIFKNKENIKKNKKQFLLTGDIRRRSNELPEFQSSKIILKTFGNIHGFAVNTHQGVVRNYNEDRVSILLNAHQKYPSSNF